MRKGRGLGFEARGYPIVTGLESFDERNMCGQCEHTDGYALLFTTTSRYLLEHIAIEDVRPITNTIGGISAGTDRAEGATAEANRGVDVELRETYKAYQVIEYRKKKRFQR